MERILGSADRDADEPLSFHENLEIGTTSVKVIADSTRSSRALVACEQILYTLEPCGDCGPSTNSFFLNKVWITDPSNPAFRQRTLDSFTQASSVIPRGYSKFGAGSLFLLASSSLLLADLSSSPEPEMVPRRLPLNGTPTRVLYSERLDKLVVLYTITTIDSISQAGSRRHRLQRRVLNPAIAFVDPDAEFLRSDLDGEGGLNVLQDSHVQEGERYLGVMEWFPTDGSNRYHFVVVHTSIGQPASDEATGRLLLFSCDMSSAGKITLNLKKDMLKKDMDRGEPPASPVWCVAPCGDSSLIYASGDDIILRKLDMGSKRFEKTSTITLRSRATHISVEEKIIHVSTKTSGHHIFYNNGDKLVPLCADASGRSNIYHLSIPESPLVISANTDCGIAGLWRPAEAQLGRTTALLFEATLPASVTRLCEIARPRWQPKLPGPQTDPIIGSSEDGALYQVIVLTEPFWRVLAFIQNVAMRDPRICPYPPPLIHESHIEPQAARKRNMHINGDIFSRLLERGGASLLEDMLQKDPDPDHRSSDYATADDRRDRFRELVAAVRRNPEGNIVESAIDMIDNLLLSAI